MTETFGELLAEAMAAKGLSDYKLSAAIGLLSGDRVFNNVQIRRLRTGERQTLTRELVARLIVVLDLDPDEAWAASGLLPYGFKAEHFRELGFFTRDRNGVIARKLTILPVDDSLDDQIRRLRPPRPQVDRRQGDRRRTSRHLKLVA